MCIRPRDACHGDLASPLCLWRRRKHIRLMAGCPRKMNIRCAGASVAWIAPSSYAGLQPANRFTYSARRSTRARPGLAMVCSRFPLLRLFPSVIAFLAGCLLLSLAACGGGDTNSGSTQPALTVSPGSLQITAGASGQKANLLLTASPASVTTVAVSGLPGGVTISPSPLSVTRGTALPIAVTASTSAAAAAATVTFTPPR